MKLTEIYLLQGESGFGALLKGVSMGRLRSFQIFDRVKTRLRVTKLNTETLRKVAPRLWERLREGDEDLAADLAQAILISNLDLIIAALDLLGIPHEGGFFAKDAEPKKYLTDGWQQRVYDALKDQHSPALVQFYVNHLAREMDEAAALFAPAAAV